MKKLALLYSTYTPTIDSIIAHLKDFDVTCLTAPDNLDTYDLVANINYKGEIEQNHVAVHHSLLPAFESEEPVKDAILAGVKVTGIFITLILKRLLHNTRFLYQTLLIMMMLQKS